MAVYYTNSKIDNVDFMEASDLEAIEAGFAAVNLDMIDLSGITDAPTALTNLGLTAVAAEINVLDGIPGTLTAIELGYVDGVTSSIQPQINLKAPLDSPAFTTTATLDGVTLATRGANTFTGAQFIESAAPVLYLRETDAAVDNRLWRVVCANETFAIQALTDAFGTVTPLLTATRTSTTIDSVNLQATSVQVNGVEAATRGANTFTGPQTAEGGLINVGVDDTTAGIINLYGPGTANAEGGELRLYTGADYDTTYNFFAIDAFEDDLRIYSAGTTFVHLKPTEGTFNVQNVTLQQDGVAVATLNTNWLLSDITDVTSTAAELNVLDGIPGTLTATEIGYLDGVTSVIQTQINLKAPLASPSLTGVPTAPTAAAGTNTTQLATTAFVQTKMLTVLKTADESVTSSTVLQNDNHLLLSVEASSSYILEMLISFTGDSTGDMQMQFTGPTGFDYELFGTNTYDGSSPAAGIIFPFSMTEAGAKVIQVTSSATYFIKLHGVVNISTTAGTLTFQFAQVVSSATPLVVRQNSYLKLVKIT